MACHNQLAKASKGSLQSKQLGEEKDLSYENEASQDEAKTSKMES